MNNVARGVILVAAVTALWYALRLSFAYIGAYLNGEDKRRRVLHHVFWLPAALVLTIWGIVETLLIEANADAPLTWRDSRRLTQSIAIVLGLLPLWQHHRAAAGARQEREHKRSEPSKAKSTEVRHDADT